MCFCRPGGTTLHTPVRELRRDCMSLWKVSLRTYMLLEQFNDQNHLTRVECPWLWT